MTVTGGTTWLAGDTGFLSASASTFASTDPVYNNAIWLYDSSGNRARLQIATYTSPTQVSVLFLDPVPATMRGTAIINWTYAKTNFSGLTNLIGATVAIQADASVLPPQVVSSTGTLTLPVACGVVHAGLPYVSQLQSLNFNNQGQASIRNQMKTASRLSVVIDQSLPFSVGTSFTNLVDVETREFEMMGQAIIPHTGVIHTMLPSVPSDDATICLQMSDPAPLTVLGWMVDVDIGQAG